MAKSFLWLIAITVAGPGWAQTSDWTEVRSDLVIDPSGQPVPGRQAFGETALNPNIAAAEEKILSITNTAIKEGAVWITAEAKGYQAGDFVLVKLQATVPKGTGPIDLSGTYQIQQAGEDGFSIGLVGIDSSAKFLPGGTTQRSPFLLTFQPDDKDKTSLVTATVKVKIQFYEERIREVVTKAYTVPDENLCKGMTIANFETMHRWTEQHEQKHVTQIESELKEILGKVRVRYLQGIPQYKMEDVAGASSQSQFASTLVDALKRKYMEIAGKDATEYTAAGGTSKGKFEGPAREASCSDFLNSPGAELQAKIRDAQKAVKDVDAKIAKERQEIAEALKEANLAKQHATGAKDCKDRDQALKDYEAAREKAEKRLESSDGLEAEIKELLGSAKTAIDAYDHLKIDHLLDKESQRDMDAATYAAKAVFKGLAPLKTAGGNSGDDQRKAAQDKINAYPQRSAADQKSFEESRRLLDEAKKAADAAKEDPNKCPDQPKDAPKPTDGSHGARPHGPVSPKPQNCSSDGGFAGVIGAINCKMQGL